MVCNGLDNLQSGHILAVTSLGLQADINTKISLHFLKNKQLILTI